jgi:hypothetical protein
VSITISVGLILIGILEVLFAVLVMRNVLASPLLPELPAQSAKTTHPRVSVVIAARDEEARIEGAVRGILAQKGVDLELIVVDDRSRDGTPRVLESLKKAEPRLAVVRVDELPAGWLGKCHACHQGAHLATREWILFCDGDIHMTPYVIARAVAVCERDQAAHVALWPRVDSKPVVVRAVLLAWAQCLALYAPAAQINRDRGKKGVGIGAFNLVRKSAYEQIGGHVPLRMEVVDDVKLGFLLRKAGFRQRVYGAMADVEAGWAQSVAEILRLSEKNWFAGMGFHLPKTAAVIGLFWTFILVSLAGPLLDPAWGWIPFAGLFSTVVPAVHQARSLGWPWVVALLAPFGFFLFGVAGVRSTWKTLRQGGIRWRDTFYPLEELRRGLVN